MPETSFIVSSNDFSGQIRPSKPSGMPMTFHPYLRMAALVAARITAFRPGASPPPVAIPMQRMSDIEVGASPCWTAQAEPPEDHPADHTLAAWDGKLTSG